MLRQIETADIFNPHRRKCVCYNSSKVRTELETPIKHLMKTKSAHKNEEKGKTQELEHNTQRIAKKCVIIYIYIR